MEWKPAGQLRLPVENVRIPSVKGLPDEIYYRLHRSYVRILKMRKSIERADANINASLRAAVESEELLKRVRLQGF